MQAVALGVEGREWVVWAWKEMQDRHEVDGTEP